MMLVAKPAGAGPRDVEVVIGQSENTDAAGKTIADVTSKGFAIDLLFTGSRDGSHAARRERVVTVLSRDRGVSSGPAARLGRSSSFGTFGSGAPLGAAPFWDRYYVFAWMPADRRTTWASPVRLSANEATCIGLEWKLRADAPRDSAWDIVGLVARKLPTEGYELVYLTDQRLGGSR
jgi:hypothetical protein